MDIYRDYFTRENLAFALTKAPYIPGYLAAAFETIPLSSTTLAAEEPGLDDVDETAGLIPRGAPPPALELDKREVHTFSVSTYAHQAAVRADEVLNARSAGTQGAAEVITTRRDATIAKLRRWVDAKHEYLRLATMKSPNNAFGSKPAEVQIALGTDATKTRAQIFEKIVLPMEGALAGLPFTGIDVWCSNGFWTSLLGNKEMRDSYLYNEASMIRGETRDGFSYGGVNFLRYRGRTNTSLTANKAIAIPSGVPGLFLQAFAPNDTLDSVGAGALGAPYYLRADDLPKGKGWELSIQTHPVMVCTRPACVLDIGL